MKRSGNWLIKILIALCLGVLLGHNYGVPISDFTRITVSCTALFSAALASFTKLTKKGFFTFLAFFILGLILISPAQNSIYFSPTKSGDAVLIRLTQTPEEKPKSLGVEADVLGQKNENTLTPDAGRLLLYIEKSQDALSLKEGDLLLINTRFDSIVNAPEQTFDAEGFYNKKGIYHRSYVSSEKWQHIGYRESRSVLSRWRDHLGIVIESWTMHAYSTQVMKALVLGDKRKLDKDLQQSYANAGVVHILAVSGLHVGVIFLLMSVVLNRITNPKQQVLRSALIIAALWLYALLTGLSPSVWRASTMFSLITIGRNLGRITGIYNTLCTSALLLLILEPSLLFSPGFQLSYAAVFGIVRYQPLILSMWTPGSKWLMYIWEIMSVSLAAQLLTMPFTFYYFQQFPTYFLLANLLIIPLISIIMITSIITLIFGAMLDLPAFITLGMDYAFRFPNTVVKYINAWPMAVLQTPPLSLYFYLLFFTFTICLLEACAQRRGKWAIATLMSAILCVVLI